MKEKRIECSKIVVRKHYPHELLDILDTSDPEDFEDKAEALSKVGFRSPYPDYVPETIHGSPKSMSSKHVPRPYGIRNWED